MNKSIRTISAAVLACAGLAMAGVGVPTAWAASKTCQKNQWPGTLQCLANSGGLTRVGESEGITEDGIKKLGVRNAQNITSATAQGLTVNNAPIAGCSITDTSPGTASIYDTTGCSTAAAFKVTIVW